MLAVYTIPVMLVPVTEMRGLAKDQHYPVIWYVWFYKIDVAIQINVTNLEYT